MNRSSCCSLLVCSVLGLMAPPGGAAILHVIPEQAIIITLGTVSNPKVLDLDGDGLTDLSFTNTGIQQSVVPGTDARIAIRNNLAAALLGEQIEEVLVHPLVWSDQPDGLYACAGNDGGIFYDGEYSGGGGILGVEFEIGGQTHYGWVLIETFPPFVGGQILEWAYESEPGEGIQAYARACPKVRDFGSNHVCLFIWTAHGRVIFSAARPIQAITSNPASSFVIFMGPARGFPDPAGAGS